MSAANQPVCWIIAGPHGAGKATFALPEILQILEKMTHDG